MPELSTTSVSLLSPRPSPSPHWQLPTLEMVVSPGQKIVPVRPKGQLHHPKPAKASLGQWKVQAATWREACWAEGLPEGEEEKGPWVFSHRPAYLPCKGLGLEVRVGASATPGCSPHTCRPLCASFFSLSVELPSEASPRALSEQGGPGPSPGRAGPGGRKQQPAPRWVVAQQGFQWRPACAPGEHRKQVGLVDPRPHKGSRHLEGSSMQTREATYLCSLAGAIAHLQPVVRWGSLGCKHHSAAESGERWSSKGWIWVI